MIQKQLKISRQPTSVEARLFCDVCFSVYRCWVTYKIVFEEINPLLRREGNISMLEFYNSPIGSVLSILDRTLGNQIVLEITKLHDPAKMGEYENVCIDLYVSHVEWSEEEWPNIKYLNEELEVGYNHIKSARNKMLAHNDRTVLNSRISLGGFPEGVDEDYFRALGELCILIREKFQLDYPRPLSNKKYHFSKDGKPGDPNCPARHAREFRDMLVRSSIC